MRRGLVCEQGPNAVRHRGTLALGERGDEADRRHARDDTLRVDLVDEPKTPVLERREEGRPLEGIAPPLGQIAGSVTPIGLDQLAEPDEPELGFLAAVPDQAEPATGPKHAMDLRERRAPVEPVESLRDGDRIDRAVAERDRLGGPAHDLHRGKRSLDQGPHARGRLDRNDRRPGRREAPRELSGAGGEVEDGCSRPDPECRAQAGDRVVGVARAAALVLLAGAVERARSVVDGGLAHPSIVGIGLGYRPSVDVLLIVDFQNDFCPGGALAVTHGDRIAGPLNRLLDGFDLVIATRDWHPPEHGSFSGVDVDPERWRGTDPPSIWPVHCVQGTSGAELSPKLDRAKVDLVVDKGQEPTSQGYSAFQDTGLGELLRERGVEHLYVGGLATDYCVKQSVLDARREGFDVTVVEDAVRGVEVEPGDSAGAVDEMREAGATFESSDAIAAARTAARR